MDYSKYSPEDAARLRQHDERIQLLREQRELGQQILKEMDVRDTYVATLDVSQQQTPNASNTTDFRTRMNPTHARAQTMGVAATIEKNSAPSSIIRDEEDDSIAAARVSSQDRRKKPLVLRSPSSDTDFVPTQKKPKGTNAKQYPLFSDDKKYLSIVKIGDLVVELACHVCGGNYFRSTEGECRHLNGVQGVQKHVQMSHPKENQRIKLSGIPFFRWVSENCIRHILSDDEQESVTKGQYHVRRIMVRTIHDDDNAY